MRLGEVGLLTNDVIRLADFYKALLETDNGSDDEVHQTMLYSQTDRNDAVSRFNVNFLKKVTLNAAMIG